MPLTDTRDPKRRRSTSNLSADSIAADATSVATPAAPANPKTRGTRYECDYCRKDITQAVRIRCAQCLDFDLCVECFSMGVEVLAHKNDHDYRVLEYISEPIFDKDWGADEEKLLLEAVLLFGFGNWQDIAEHVGTKSKQKCQAHYCAVYLSSAASPLPQMETTLLDFKEYRSRDDSASIDRRLSIIGGLDSPLVSGGDAVNASSTKKTGSSSKPQIPKTNQDTSLARMIGFIPKRGDFDTEYKNDDELMLSDMEFFEGIDTPEEHKLKLDVIQIYNQTLDERQRRKDFIIERELLVPCMRKHSREERDIMQKMASFARFHSRQSHDEFIQGLMNEHRLRKRIEQLQHHRLVGIHTLTEGVVYEVERKKRDASKHLRRDKERLDYLFSAPRQTTSSRRRRSGPDMTSPTNLTETDQPVTPPSTAAKTPSLSIPRIAAFNVSSMDGFHELASPFEADLCSKLRITPRQFIEIKHRLLTESAQRGLLTPEHANDLIRVDINKTDRIFDIFFSTGWSMDSNNNGHIQIGTAPAIQPTVSAMVEPAASTTPC